MRASAGLCSKGCGHEFTSSYEYARGRTWALGRAEKNKRAHERICLGKPPVPKPGSKNKPVFVCPDSSCDARGEHDLKMHFNRKNGGVVCHERMVMIGMSRRPVAAEIVAAIRKARERSLFYEKGDGEDACGFCGVVVGEELPYLHERGCPVAVFEEALR